MTWYELDRRRLVREVIRVHSAYKNFRLLLDDHQLLWEGELFVNVAGVDADPLCIRLIYPEAFPARAPKVKILKPELDPSEVGHAWHRWYEGNVCFIRPSDWEIGTTADEVIAKSEDWYFNYVAVKRGLIPKMPDIGRALVPEPQES